MCCPNPASDVAPRKPIRGNFAVDCSDCSWADLGRTRATTIGRWLLDPVSARTYLRSSGRIQFFALGSSSVVVARQNQHSGLSTSNLVRRGTPHVIGVRTARFHLMLGHRALHRYLGAASLPAGGVAVCRGPDSVSVTDCTARRNSSGPWICENVSLVPPLP